MHARADPTPRSPALRRTSARTTCSAPTPAASAPAPTTIPPASGRRTRAAHPDPDLEAGPTHHTHTRQPASGRRSLEPDVHAQHRQHWRAPPPTQVMHGTEPQMQRWNPAPTQAASTKTSRYTSLKTSTSHTAKSASTPAARTAHHPQPRRRATHHHPRPAPKLAAIYHAEADTRAPTAQLVEDEARSPGHIMPGAGQAAQLNPKHTT